MPVPQELCQRSILIRLETTATLTRYPRISWQLSSSSSTSDRRSIHNFVLKMSHTYFDSENSHKSFEMPGARPHYNPDRPGQVEHIFLDLVLDIPKQSFRGTCSIRINPVRSGIDKLTLDAVNLKIKSVKVGDTKQTFDSDGEFLQVQAHESAEADKPITIAIDY